MEKNKKNIKECYICGVDAVSLCFECKNYFCEKCYKYVHDKEKNSNHKKEIIDLFVPFDVRCPEHPEHPVALFCVDEKGNYIFNFLILELCCSYCCFKNIHDNHKILELSDLDSLKIKILSWNPRIENLKK